jgi:hypothetical protein
MGISRPAHDGRDPAPHAELLDRVLDPDQLRSKLSELAAARRKHQDELNALVPEQRLPGSYLDDPRR